jgi:hypothetical protein
MSGRLLKWFSRGVEIADKEVMRFEMTSGDVDCGPISFSMLLSEYSKDELNGRGRLRCTGEAFPTGAPSWRSEEGVK